MVVAVARTRTSRHLHIGDLHRHSRALSRRNRYRRLGDGRHAGLFHAQAYCCPSHERQGANRALFTYRQVKPVDSVLVRAGLESSLMMPKTESGEVVFPNAIAFDAPLRIEDYIRRAGGYTQNANVSRVLIAHRDGSFDEGSEADRGFFSNADNRQIIRPGDEVLVLPRIDTKSRQIWKDMTQIIYQVAVSAKVIFGL